MHLTWTTKPFAHLTPSELYALLQLRNREFKAAAQWVKTWYYTLPRAVRKQGVFGTLTGKAVRLLRNILQDFPGPVMFGFPSGHTTGPCWTLPLGVRVRVVTNPRPVIVVEESPVE